MEFILEEHAVGDHVEFNWNHFLNPEASPSCYECIIIANHGKIGYDVEMIENHVLNDPIMMYTKDGGPLVVGSTVSYNWRYSGNWYDYVVTMINEDRTVNLSLECLSVSPEFLRKLTEHEKYAVNETVEYEWGGGCNWFEATVVAVNPNGTYDIALFDEAVAIEHLSLATGLGPTEPRPLKTRVTPGSLYEGQLVEYNWQGKGYWYLNYTVMKVLSDTTCDVQLIDKDICCGALRRKTTVLALELSTLESEKALYDNVIATIAPVADEVQPFAVDDVIQHNWNEGGTWWDNYRITTVRDGDTIYPLYDLTYSDDTEVHNVPAALIRRPESELSKAVRELPRLNSRIKVLRSKLEVVRSETTHGKNDVSTLDALEKLLGVVLAESKAIDERNFAATISWNSFFDASEEVLKLTERLVAGREKALFSMHTPDTDTTMARALSLQQKLEALYYASEDARTKYWSLKNLADCKIYAVQYRSSVS